MLSRKASSECCCGLYPKTDTGGQVENTEAIERTVVKEFGKIPP